MNNNIFKVLTLLTKNPGKWYDIQTVAFNTNLTNRQALSTITMMKIPYVVKGRDNDNKLIIRFDGDDDAVKETQRIMIIEHYRITDEHRKKVYNTLSSAGWMSVTDLLEETGLPKNTLSRTLMVTDGVVSMKDDTSVFYRRISNYE